MIETQANRSRIYKQSRSWCHGAEGFSSQVVNATGRAGDRRKAHREGQMGAGSGSGGGTGHAGRFRAGHETVHSVSFPSLSFTPATVLYHISVYLANCFNRHIIQCTLSSEKGTSLYIAIQQCQLAALTTVTMNSTLNLKPYCLSFSILQHL